MARTVAHANYAETYTKLPSYLPGWERSKRQRPPRWCQEKKIAPRMIGVDCEMCETDQDTRALVGVSVVDVDGGILLKTLVKPPGKIVDLKEDITGLKMKDFKGVKTTLADVQASLRDIVTPETILVGHGLVHDLKALKFDHLPVIDTAFLFSYKNLPRSTPGLADLCKRLLSSEMRAEGKHDSVEDAKMALELAKWECANGPTGPLDPPEDKVDPRDLTKLFVHRVPRGTLEEDLRGLFSKDNGTIGVDHAGDLEAVHGKFLGPETPLDSSRTTSAYIEFKTVDACNMAFKSLRGQQGTDALGRPQKSVKMVVKSDGKDDAKGGGAKGGKPKLTNLSRMTVADLKKELEKRKLDTSGLKAALVARLEEAQANNSDGDGEKGEGAKGGKPKLTNLSRMTVADLKKELEKRKLDTSGLKAALVARLEEAQANDSGDNSEDDSDSDVDDGEAEKKTVTVMVRKMAAHQGRAIGTKDKNNEPPRTGEKRKAPGSEEKKPRRNPRPSRRARLAAKGIYE